MTWIFIDGNDLRRDELARLVPDLAVTVEPLQTGFSTSAPEPAHRARDKVLAHHAAGGCFAEAVDLTTMDGKSLQLELDSENANRFCKYWRETPVRMVLAIALRRGADAEIEMFTTTCDGAIAARPAGPLILGWDRLFVPTGESQTLAELVAAGGEAALHRDGYQQLADALGL